MVAAPSGELETERLVLRRFRREDWRELQDYVSLPEVTRFDFEYPSTVEGCQELADYFSGQLSVSAVCLKDSGRLIGHAVSSQVPPSAFLTWDLGVHLQPRVRVSGLRLGGLSPADRPCFRLPGCTSDRESLPS